MLEPLDAMSGDSEPTDLERDLGGLTVLGCLLNQRLPMPVEDSTPAVSDASGDGLAQIDTCIDCKNSNEQDWKLHKEYTT